MTAMAPETAGAAMLVPDTQITPLPLAERAAITSCPGALISGLDRPSRVGPALENQEIGALA
jgi:hypothetical protein